MDRVDGSQNLFLIHTNGRIIVIMIMNWEVYGGYHGLF